jgi:hypothetical protein
MATFLPRDHEIIEGTATLRTLLLELAGSGPPEDELYDACAMLGRVIAQQRGSPTLASRTIDHASEALGAVQPGWLVGARAAVSEGFFTALVELERAEAMNGWEFPRCTVATGHDSIAIVAGHPASEHDVLVAWADRAAKGAALRGVRRAVVDGPEAPRRAIAEALRLAGIEVVEPEG